MDLVLGVNWLSVWNPVVNWKEQIMHIWTGKEWSNVQGVLLHSENNIGTVKDFVHYDVDSKEKIPDFIVMKKPQFWVTEITKLYYRNEGKAEEFIPDFNVKSEDGKKEISIDQCQNTPKMSTP